MIDSIDRERAGIDYYSQDKDKQILLELFNEINEYTGASIQYLSEIDLFKLDGTGEILSRYVTKFSSESVKCYLIPQIVSDRIKDCDRLILQLYLQFKASDEYISLPGNPAPTHIYVRYDNAFKALKSKRIKNNLIELVSCPRDAFYLPLTVKMLASWRVPELKSLLITYSSENNITAHDIGLMESEEEYFPPLSFIKRELRFTAIESLKYYPSLEIYEIIKKYTDESDCDIRAIAKKTLRQIEKNYRGESITGRFYNCE